MPVPRERVSLSMPPDLIERLAAAAKARRPACSLSALVSLYADEGLRREQAERPKPAR